MTKEPLWTVAGIVGIVGALISLVVAFGLSLTADQQKAILGAATVVAPLIVAWVTRPKVTPVAKASKVVDRQAGFIQNGWLGALVLVLAAIVLLIIIVQNVSIKG